MYSVMSTPQLNFSNAFGWKSVSSAKDRGSTWQISSSMCKKGCKEGVPHPSYLVHWEDESYKVRQDSMIYVPKVIVQNYLSEREALNEDMLLWDKSKIYDSIDYIKNMLGSMDDGQITISPYDTAWVALIRDFNGRDVPQFPSSIEWISNNQIADGSWGDEHFFLAYDRLLNTLACVVALRHWNVHFDMSEKGIKFIKENINKLEDANAEQMTSGFEVVFPALLQRAKSLGIGGLPYDAPVIQEILAVRDRKMARVPEELFHYVPTCLLHNLEGFDDLEWEKILKLQSPKGSFITSPAATSFAIMETKDEHCITYIQNIVNKFNGGAPTVYPVDIYARLWAVDRLERLGISRFFDPEIKNCLDYIYRYWSDKGVFSARDSEFVDIDDTSMGFRLLRLHGYNITPNALNNFKKGKEFTCYVGQGFESPSPIFNLYRASQVLYPGETILQEANEFSYNFLKERLKNNQLLDKWLISKHLPEEIRDGLDMPWYARLPRVEARFYLENYGVDDIWIGKSLYRMPEINNCAYLELGKLDYNRCQAQHRKEWNHIQQWYDDNTIEEFGRSKKDILLVYFLATASIFEPEKSRERLAWVKSQIVSSILSTYYKEATSSEQKNDLSTEFRNKLGSKCYKSVQKLITMLLETLRALTTDAQEWNDDIDSSDLLLDVWGLWLKNLGEGVEEIKDVELIIWTINICAGNIVSKDILSHLEYRTLSGLTGKICHQLREYENEKLTGMKLKNTKSNREFEYEEIEKDMQLLVQLVYQESTGGISKDIKETFLVVAKSFYYRAYFSRELIDNHVSKVLFEQVL